MLDNKRKCKLGVCTCMARPGDSYCSDYCRQASSQGLQRDFCQCEHSICTKVAEAFETSSASLPGSISFAPGLVTIQYSDVLDLRDQLILLAARLEAEPAEFPGRRPAARELSTEPVFSKTALGQSA